MTPKEKAIELVTKYRRFLPMNLTTMLDAKGCAIIAVDEMIRIAPWGGDFDGIIEDNSKEFYMDVKQEIEKL